MKHALKNPERPLSGRRIPFVEGFCSYCCCYTSIPINSSYLPTCPSSSTDAQLRSILCPKLTHSARMVPVHTHSWLAADLWKRCEILFAEEGGMQWSLSQMNKVMMMMIIGCWLWLLLAVAFEFRPMCVNKFESKTDGLPFVL